MEEPVYAVVKKERRKIVKSSFLVAFLVDSRGAALTGCRKSGLRVLVPANALSKPTRIVLRYVNLMTSSRVSSSEVWLPPLGDFGCLATGVLELSSSPWPLHTEKPFLLEIPHFLAKDEKHCMTFVLLQSKDGQRWNERHVITKSDNKQEHMWQLKEEQEVYEDVCQQTELVSASIELSCQRIIRTSLLGHLPRYLVVVARPPVVMASVDSSGQVVTFSNDQWVVQLAFPRDAVTKRIKAGIQVVMADRSQCWIRVLPQDRKFHRPITCVLKSLGKESDQQWLLVRFGGGRARLLTKDEYEHSSNEICVASKTSMELCLNRQTSDWPRRRPLYVARLRAFFKAHYPHAWCDCLKVYIETRYTGQAGCIEAKMADWQLVVESEELEMADGSEVNFSLSGDWSVANYMNSDDAISFMPTHTVFRALNEESTHVFLLLKRRVQDANNAQLAMRMDKEQGELGRQHQWPLKLTQTSNS